MGKNKPRHILKQDGVRTSDYCSCCGYYDCNPMFASNSIAEKKKRDRFSKGLCKACGNKVCKCKNKKGY